jgi:hypothetical protein
MSAPELGLAMTMVMAPTGHSSAQRPWPMHLCPLMMVGLAAYQSEHVALRANGNARAAADAVIGGDLRVLRLGPVGEQRPAIEGGAHLQPRCVCALQ